MDISPNIMRADEKNKRVYILLTRTDTYLSRLIAAVTRTRYTHASLSLDFYLTRLYSFGRLYAYNPFIGCFKREETTSGVYARFRRSPCALFELEVTEASYEAISARIAELERNKERYRYNFIGLFANYIGVPLRRERHYFCSEFVADTLVRGDALRINRDPSLVRPSDFLEMAELKPIFVGTLETLDEYVKERIKTEYGEDAPLVLGKAYATTRKVLVSGLLLVLVSRFKRA